jgi:nucleoside-diphosphate-sugar epimerase
LRQVLGWEPQVSLRQGIRPTYEWIERRILGKEAEANLIAAE